jgi:sulfite reductase (ferredoxin)
MFLGGGRLGNRLNFLYKDAVPLEDIVPVLRPIFAAFAEERQAGETFGDFCQRIGKDGLEARADQQASNE